MRDEAEVYIKELYMDHEHCALHARAVAMFLRGVDWVLAKSRTNPNKQLNLEKSKQQGENNEVRG